VETIGAISQERLQIEVKLLYREPVGSHMPRRLARQLTGDLEWPFHAWRTVSMVA